MRIGPRISILLLDDEQPTPTFKIFTQNIDNKETVWSEVNSSDFDQFKQSLKKYIQPVIGYNNIIGFMSLFKNKRIVFKTKNIEETRNNTGAYCENAGKNDIIARLNNITDRTTYSETNINQNITIEGVSFPNLVFKNGLCVMMEIILRYYDETKHKGKRWFFNSEEAILNRIAEQKKR